MLRWSPWNDPIEESNKSQKKKNTGCNLNCGAVFFNQAVWP